MSRGEYRPDIDGLRAVAVLLVVGYHYFPRQVTGGFVGVDVFFVISGYLISRLIADGLARGEFSAWRFYGARVRRIFPALLTVLAGVLCGGWLVLLAAEYAPLGRHVAAGAAFIANLATWQETSYFDTAATTKPLLHLWSLGVEEQFYLLWPLGLLGLWRLGRRMWPAALLVAAISFAWSVHLTATDPTAAFYSPFSRLWELALGGVLAGVERERAPMFARIPTWASIVGLVAVLGGAGVFGPGSTFPGWHALLPTVGAALVIAAGPEGWLNRRVLSNRVMVAIGLISYPLYLWHWPVLTFARIVAAVEFSAGVRLGLLGASLILTVLTYWLVERPVRARRTSALLVGTLCVVNVVIGAAGWIVYARGGFGGRRAADAQVTRLFETSVLSSEARACFDLPSDGRSLDTWKCHAGRASSSADGFVFGDSHALALVPAFERLSTEGGASFEFAGQSQCPPLLGIDSLGTMHRAGACRALNDRVFAYVREHGIRRVFLVAYWAFYTDGGYGGPEHSGMIPVGRTLDSPKTQESSREAFEFGLQRTVEAYRAIDVEVFFVKDSPIQVQEPAAVFRQSARVSDRAAFITAASVPRRRHEALQALSNGRLAAVVGPGVHVVDLDDVYCDAAVCGMAVGDTSMYRDLGHLSVAGALRTTDVFRRLLRVPRVF